MPSYVQNFTLIFYSQHAFSYACTYNFIDLGIPYQENIAYAYEECAANIVFLFVSLRIDSEISRTLLVVCRFVIYRKMKTLDNMAYKITFLKYLNSK